MEKEKIKEITYESLEEKIKKQLNYSIDHGHNDGFVHAKNLSETLLNLLKILSR